MVCLINSKKFKEDFTVMIYGVLPVYLQWPGFVHDLEDEPGHFY